jgi:carbon-monoxide dehydrogenase medium subunit
MFPASFKYHKPGSLIEAVELLATLGDEAKLLAGGHSLIPALKLRLAQPQHLIDLSGVGDLNQVRVTGDTLIIGATTTHWQVESSPVVRNVLPYLSKVAALIADPQVRNRGTIGGSVVNADPAADYPASILALNAEMVCISRSGQRVVEAADWFQGLMTTAIEESEILSEIRIPLLSSNSVATYLKLPHPASRFAVVGIAAIATLTADGQCADARIGVTGVGSTASRATDVERQLLHQRFDVKRIDHASDAACEGLDIDGDMHFSADDKRQLCRVYVRRALHQLRALAESGSFQPAIGDVV